MEGAQFVRKRATAGARVAPGRGLCIGRALDTQLSRYVDGKLKLSPSDRRHERLYQVVCALRAAGIRLVATQVPVSMGGVGTRIDAVGVRSGDLVVVELKATQHTRESHGEVYDLACSKRERLSNGLPNTERCHHYLQCAFGALGVRAAAPKACFVHGVVVLSYCNGAAVVHTPHKYMSRTWFAQPPARRAAPPAKAAAGPFVNDQWPDMQNSTIVSAVGSSTATDVGSGCVLLEGGRVAVCVRRPWRGVSARAKKLVASSLLKTTKRIFKQDQNRCTTHVLAPVNKHWCLLPYPTPPCPQLAHRRKLRPTSTAGSSQLHNGRMPTSRCPT